MCEPNSALSPPSKETSNSANPEAQLAAAPPAVRSEWDKMVSSEPYNFMLDPALRHARIRVRRLVKAYNDLPWSDPDISNDYMDSAEQQALLGKVFGVSAEEIKAKWVYIEPPFAINYGVNVSFKGEFYANVNLVLLDDAPITIGTGVFCGPRVGLYTATHSTDVAERKAYDIAYPIEIGDDCWIGAGAIINGPSKIGAGCTVAAGAVVRGTFPDNCLIGGVPAKIIKYLVPPKDAAADPAEDGEVPM